MVRFLLEAGADQEHKTDEMHTALMEACMVRTLHSLFDSFHAVKHTHLLPLRSLDSFSFLFVNAVFIQTCIGSAEFFSLQICSPQ